MPDYVIWTADMEVRPVIGDYFLSNTDMVFIRAASPNNAAGYWRQLNADQAIIDRLKLELAQIKERRSVSAPNHYGDF